MRMSRRMAIKAITAKYKITYTGNYTEKVITSEGKRYLLLTLTSSGQLTVEGDVVGDICLVGGGANGLDGDLTTGRPGAGGAGAYLENFFAKALKNAAVTIGAARQNTVLGELIASGAIGKSAGTGRGAPYGSTAGTGDGRTKYPLGDTVDLLRNQGRKC